MMGRNLVAGVAVALGVLMSVTVFSIGPYLAPSVLALLWAEEAMARSADPVLSRLNPVQHFARVWFGPWGAIPRRTYWLSGLLGLFAFQITVSLLLLWFDLLRDLEPGDAGFTKAARDFMDYVIWPFGMAVVCAKRARDIGRSGWWGLAILIPVSAGFGLAALEASDHVPVVLIVAIPAVQVFILIAFGTLKRR